MATKVIKKNAKQQKKSTPKPVAKAKPHHEKPKEKPKAKPEKVKKVLKAPVKPMIKAKPVAPAKPIAKKVEAKKVELKKIEPKKVEHKKVEAKKVEVKKVEPKKPLAPPKPLPPPSKAAASPLKTEVKRSRDQKLDDGEATWAVLNEPPPENEIPKDPNGNPLCRAKECDQIANVEAYCRYHYLLHWKKIQVRKKILADGKLQRYVEELTSRYPDKYLEVLYKDLKTEKDFLAVIAELELDENAVAEEADFEEDSQSLLEEVKGMDTGATTEEEF